MNISERLVEMTAGVREQAGPYAAKAGALARQFGARLLEQQTTMVKGMAREGNERLRMFSKAPNLQSALNQQFKYFDVTRERLARDVRDTYAILTEAGRDVSELAVSSYQHMTGKTPAARRAAAKAAAKPAAKPAANPAARKAARSKQAVKTRARKAA